MSQIDIKSPKMLREALCKAQFALSRDGMRDSLNSREKETIQDAINAIDLVRPLGADGKHGNRHTANCGCVDKGETIDDRI